MAQEHLRLTSAERSDLVAYLDGELSESQAQVVAAKLTRSVSARHEVEMLTATWDLLDILPRLEPSPEFKTRTLSLAIQTTAPEDQWLELARSATQRLGKILIVFVSTLLMIAIGYVTTRWIWPDPTARLAQDLSIAEHLDEYQAVREIEFVQMLDNSTILGTIPTRQAPATTNNNRSGP
jgi:hypothetical protein